MGSQFGNLGTGGKFPLPKIKAPDEKACNVELAATGTTKNEPNTKPIKTMINKI